MDISKTIKKHFVSIRKFNAYSYAEAVKQGILFPYDYYLRKGKSNYPLNIVLFLTLRCNAKCFMCNLKEMLNKDKQEMSVEKIDSFLREVKGFKPSIVLFGGEPLIRTDFIDILKKVKKYNLSCGIFTNGLLFNPDKVKEIIKLKMNYIAFSLQGIGKKHDEIVGIKGAYEKMIKVIREFTKYKNRKTKVILHTTISESNLDELGKIVELGEKLGVDLIRFGHPTFFTEKDIERNKKVVKAIFPENKIEEVSYHYDPKEKSKEYYNKIKLFMRKYKNRMVMTPDLNPEEVKNWYSSEFKSKRKCVFVYRGTFIFPNGDVVPCESFKFIMGNINKQKFMNIWNSEKYQKFRRTVRKGLLPACARCCKL